MRGHTTLLGVAVCAIACTDAMGSFFFIRDAEGGEDFLGSPGGYYLVGTGGSPRGTVDGSGTTMATGVFDLEIRQQGGEWMDFFAFCTEPDLDLGFPEYPAGQDGFLFEAIPLTSGGFSAADEDVIEVLWANAFDLAMSGDVAAGAFQAIVWELVQDDTIDFSDGLFTLNEAFSFTGDVADLAREWLDNIDQSIWTERINLNVLTSPFSQDLIIPVGDLPAPGTMALAAVALGVVSRRRR